MVRPSVFLRVYTAQCAQPPSVTSVNRNEEVVLVPFVHALVPVLCEQRHDLASLGLLAIVLDGPGPNAISIEGECPQRFQFSALDVQGHEMNERRGDRHAPGCRRG